MQEYTEKSVGELSDKLSRLNFAQLPVDMYKSVAFNDRKNKTHTKKNSQYRKFATQDREYKKH